MSFFDWDNDQNNRLRASRGIGFEDAVFYIERGDLVDILESHQAVPDSSQRVFVVQGDGEISPRRSSGTASA